MQKVEHIGIAVKELSVSIPLFEILLNTNCYKTETVEAENVKTAFLKKVKLKYMKYWKAYPRMVL